VTSHENNPENATILRNVYGANEIYPQRTPVGDIAKEQWKAQSTPIALGWNAHAAPMQLLFYTGPAFRQRSRAMRSPPCAARGTAPSLPDGCHGRPRACQRRTRRKVYAGGTSAEVSLTESITPAGWLP
jgi:hypothetical protein